MKITIEKQKASVRESQPGDILLGGNGNKNYFLQLVGDRRVILNFANGDGWFHLSDNSIEKNNPIRVIGKIKEIIVESYNVEE